MSLIKSLKPAQAAQAIEELQNSLGWKILAERLEEDVLEAVYGMGDNPNMSEAEIHFRRGSIYATRNMAQLPIKMSMYFQNIARMAHTDADKER